MKIAVIGSGYVGLVSGTCFAEFGFQTICVDKDAGKIENLKQGIIPIYEPGLDDLVQKNLASGRLGFTVALKTALENVDAVFIAVGTPSRRGDGHADLTYVYAAAKEIAENLNHDTVIVIKSTVPVGTNRAVLKILQDTRPDLNLTVASNPEFLREGSAIGDFMRPDRVIIGAEDDRAEETMRQLYRPLFLNETPVMVVSLESAELAKYAANAFLATKITFINEIADLCEKLGADVQDVARAIGLDGRIGKKFLHAGPGYGGSCFPKDTLALVKTARDAGAPTAIIEAVVDVNARRKLAMADRIKAALGGDVSGKIIAILGVTFKPNTDDMRDAPSLDIIPALQKAGATIRAVDPAGRYEAEKLLPHVEWLNDVYQAAGKADAVVVLTEWNEFRALDLQKLKAVLRQPLLIDLRNIYKPDEMRAAGFVYHSIGRTIVR